MVMNNPMRFLFAALLTAISALFGMVSHADAQDPAEIVKSTTEQVLQALREDGATADKQKIYAIVEQMVLPHFDFRKMSQWVLGKNWKQGSPQEQERFVEEFQRLLVRTYSTALTEYTNQEINYLPTRQDDDGKIATVKTEVVEPNGGGTIPIDYRLYTRDGEWKVFDVWVNGASLVTTYRTSFNEQVSTKGFSGMVEDLAAHNQNNK
jgi:phospholipid transport system substrate-binding protein